MAQSTAEETKKLAKQQADQIIAEAQVTAQKEVDELKQEIKNKLSVSWLKNNSIN